MSDLYADINDTPNSLDTEWVQKTVYFNHGLTFLSCFMTSFLGELGSLWLEMFSLIVENCVWQTWLVVVSLLDLPNKTHTLHDESNFSLFFHYYICNNFYSNFLIPLVGVGGEVFGIS
jgi:hypothetical protein